jgi:hypothetical protein
VEEDEAVGPQSLIFQSRNPHFMFEIRSRAQPVGSLRQVAGFPGFGLFLALAQTLL